MAIDATPSHTTMRIERAWADWARSRSGSFDDENRLQVRVHAGHWPLLLDVHALGGGRVASNVTRMRLACRTPRPTELQFYPRNFISDLGHVAGRSHIAIHHAAFDDGFIIKCASPTLARTLLVEDVCQRLATLADLHFTLSPLGGRSKGVSMMDMQITRLVDDAHTLDCMANSLAALADRLVELDRATPEAMRIR